MPDVKSYAWSYRLSTTVETDETVDVPTPGFKNPEKYGIEHAEVVYGDVLDADEYELAWAEDFSFVTVTNLTDEDWQPSHTLYVTVPGKTLDDGDAGGSFEALEARVSALETTVADHETRIAALESAAPPAKAG